MESQLERKIRRDVEEVRRLLSGLPRELNLRENQIRQILSGIFKIVNQHPPSEHHQEIKNLIVQAALARVRRPIQSQTIQKIDITTRKITNIISKLREEEKEKFHTLNTLRSLYIMLRNRRLI